MASESLKDLTEKLAAPRAVWIMVPSGAPTEGTIERDQILGAAILGIEGGEIVGVLQVAMMGGVPYTAIRDGVFAYPTLVESLNSVFSAMGG